MVYVTISEWPWSPSARTYNQRWGRKSGTRSTFHLPECCQGHMENTGERLKERALRQAGKIILAKIYLAIRTMWKQLWNMGGPSSNDNIRLDQLAFEEFSRMTFNIPRVVAVNTCMSDWNELKMPKINESSRILKKCNVIRWFPMLGLGTGLFSSPVLNVYFTIPI